MKSSTAHERFGDESVIVNLVSGSYFSVQGTGDVIWTLLVEGASEAAILRHVRAAFSGDSEEVARATTAFLDELVAEEIVTFEPVDGDGGASAADGQAEASGEAFVAPSLQKYTDLEELLLLDPIHEVDEAGWPSTNPQGTGQA